MSSREYTLRMLRGLLFQAHDQKFFVSQWIHILCHAHTVVLILVQGVSVKNNLLFHFRWAKVLLLSLSIWYPSMISKLIVDCKKRPQLFTWTSLCSRPVAVPTTYVLVFPSFIWAAISSAFDSEELWKQEKVWESLRSALVLDRFPNGLECF